MKTFFLTSVFVTFTILSCAQDRFEELKANKNFQPVLDIPLFPGMERSIAPQYINGKKGLDSFLATQIEKQKVVGKGVVVLMYMINKEGKITSIQVNSDTPDKLNTLVIEALKKSGPWIPGTREGKYITMNMSVSYEFK